MEKVCCEFKWSDGLEIKWVETDDGYRVELKGDKEKLKEHGPGCCCVPIGMAHGHHRGRCC